MNSMILLCSFYYIFFTIVVNLSLCDVIKLAPNPLIRQIMKWDFDLTSVKRCKTFFTVEIVEHELTSCPFISSHFIALKYFIRFKIP